MKEKWEREQRWLKRQPVMRMILLLNSYFTSQGDEYHPQSIHVLITAMLCLMVCGYIARAPAVAQNVSEPTEYALIGPDHTVPSVLFHSSSLFSFLPLPQIALFFQAKTFFTLQSPLSLFLSSFAIH